MTTLQSACRVASRITVRSARCRASRGFSSTSARLAASNFVMPAMSPTMTEGNISSWKVKEGDSFAPGDVLLEIETDKAQMDVEAQDEGKMAKIIQGDGSKAVKVGARIAILAEEDDDLSALELPAEEPAKSSQSEKKADQSASTQESKPDKAPPSEPKADAADPSASSSAAQKPRSQNYPLYPSVQVLLHQNNISNEEADKIPASGPAGRLLKGDVLSYLGTIDKSYSQELSQSIEKRTHLDLSNIEKAPTPAPSKKEQPTEAATVEETEEVDTEIAVPISLEAVLTTQERIKKSLGLVLPLSTFIARASEIANEDLPRGKLTQPSADELFDAVLGLDKVRRTSRGSFIPEITAIPSHAAIPRIYGPPKKIDIIDLLAGNTQKPPTAIFAPAPADVTSPTTQNVFSVSVPKGEERRARTYLERMKSVLESDPGRLVL